MPGGTNTGERNSNALSAQFPPTRAPISLYGVTQSIYGIGEDRAGSVQSLGGRFWMDLGGDSAAARVPIADLRFGSTFT